MFHSRIEELRTTARQKGPNGNGLVIIIAIAAVGLHTLSTMPASALVTFGSRFVLWP